LNSDSPTGKGGADSANFNGGADGATGACEGETEFVGLGATNSVGGVIAVAADSGTVRGAWGAGFTGGATGFVAAPHSGRIGSFDKGFFGTASGESSEGRSGIPFDGPATAGTGFTGGQVGTGGTTPAAGTTFATIGGSCEGAL